MSAPVGSPPAPTRIAEGGETLTVIAPITRPVEGGMRWESMPARPDPAADDQAILVAAPALCDYVNFGDVVRVGPPTNGARPMLDVLVASGHERVVAITSRHKPEALASYLRTLHPAEHLLRIGVMQPSLVAVSVHPDLDATEVQSDIADWLDDQGARDDREASISPVFESTIGPVHWPAGSEVT